MFTPNGYLSSYYKKAEEGEYVDMKSLYKYILVVTEIQHLMNEMEEIFGKVLLEDLNGHQFQIKIVSSAGRSIGYLFGFLQQMKLIYPI
jgi:hypothetical protein